MNNTTVNTKALGLAGNTIECSDIPNSKLLRRVNKISGVTSNGLRAVDDKILMKTEFKRDSHITLNEVKYLIANTTSISTTVNDTKISLGLSRLLSAPTADLACLSFREQLFIDGVEHEVDSEIDSSLTDAVNSLKQVAVELMSLALNNFRADAKTFIYSDKTHVNVDGLTVLKEGQFLEMFQNIP